MKESRPIPAQQLAVSTAGHDKGTLYVIVGREGEDFLLAADGRIRTLGAPKKKNKKHLQKISHLPENIRQMMGEIREDADLRRILKSYRQSKEEIPSGGNTCQRQT